MVLLNDRLSVPTELDGIFTVNRFVIFLTFFNNRSILCRDEVLATGQGCCQALGLVALKGQSVGEHLPMALGVSNLVPSG